MKSWTFAILGALWIATLGSVSAHAETYEPRFVATCWGHPAGSLMTIETFGVAKKKQI